MASYDQMLQHYAQLANQQQAQTDDQVRMAREQAALQSQRDAQLAQQQQEQTLQQQQLAAQRENMQAGYGQYSQVLGAGLQQQRDVLGHNIQLEQMGVGAGLQSQRDVQQSGLRQQEAANAANVQAQLAQVQLNQQEEMRLRRLNQAASSTDEQVHSGYLSPEEGAQLKTQIMTGLNPLQNRHLEAQRLQTQVQTQGMFQQNEQQATLFSQRQQRMAAGAAGNIQSVYNPDTGRNERYMVDINTGHLTPLEASSIEQQRQLHMLEQGQAIGQREQSFPAQLEHQQLANAQQRQITQFAAQMQPGNVQHQQALNDTIVQNLRQGADLHPLAMQMQGAQLADLTQRTGIAARQEPGNLRLQDANVQLAEQHVAQGPLAFASQQEYQQAQTELSQAHAGQVNAQVEEMPLIRTLRQQLQAGQLTQMEFQNQHTQAQTALLRAQADEGVPPAIASQFYQHAQTAMQFEVPPAAERTRIAALPADQQAQATETWRNEATLTRFRGAVNAYSSIVSPNRRPPAGPPAPRPNLGGSTTQPTIPTAAEPPAPNIANEPSTVGAARVAALREIAVAHHNAALNAPAGRAAASTHWALPGSNMHALGTLLDRVGEAGRPMTFEEVHQYQVLQQGIAASDPALGRRLQLSTTPTPEQRLYDNVPVSQIRQVYETANRINRNEHGPYTRITNAGQLVRRINDILQGPVNGNRVMTAGEVTNYLLALNTLKGDDPALAARLTFPTLTQR